MCVNLGSIPTWLISPAAALKGMGVKTGVEWLDPAYSFVAKTEKDKDKEEKKKENASDNAWRRYYASQRASVNPESVMNNGASPLQAETTRKGAF